MSINRASPWVRRFLWGLLLLPALLVAATGTAYWLGRDWLIRTQLEKLLQTGISFEDADVDFLTHYPYTRLSLRNVVVMSTHPTYENHIIRAKCVEVIIPLWEIGRKLPKKHVPLVRIEDADVVLFTDSTWVKNYQLFRPYDPNRWAPDTVLIESLQFVRANLLNRIEARDRMDDYRVDSLGTQILIRRTEVQFLGTHFKGKSNYIGVGSLRILENCDLEIKTTFVSDKRDRMMTISPSVLSLNGVEIAVVGRMQLLRDQLWDVRFTTDHANIGTVLSLVPESARRKLEPYSLAGQLTLDATLIGIDSENSYPHFRLEFRADSARIINQETGQALTEVVLSGVYDNGDSSRASTTYLALDTLKGSLNGYPFFGQIKLSQLDNPWLNLRFDSQFLIQDVARFAGLKLPQGTQGLVGLKLRGQGLIAWLTKLKRYDLLEYSGDLQLSDVSIPWPDSSFGLDNLMGSLRLTNQQIWVDSLRGTLAGNLFMVSGEMQDPIGFVMKQNQLIRGDLRVYAPNWDLDPLLTQFVSTRDTALTVLDSLNSTSKSFTWAFLGWQPPTDMYANVRFDLPGLQYHGQLFDTCLAAATLSDRRFRLHNLMAANPRHGLQLTMDLDARQQTHNSVTAQLTFRSDSLEGLMRQMGLPGGAVLADTKSVLSVAAVLSLEGNVSRILDSLGNPQGTLTLNLDHARVTKSEVPVAIDALHFTTTLTDAHLLSFNTTPLLINELRGELNGYSFGGSVAIGDWVDKQTEVHIQSGLPIPDFLAFFKPLPYVEDLTGDMSFDVRVSGPLDKIIVIDSLIYLDSRGTLELQNLNAKLVPSGNRFADINGSFYYDPDSVEIRTLTGIFNEQTDFDLQGSFAQILSFLFLPNTPLRAHATLRLDTLDLGPLLTDFAALASDSTLADTAVALKLPELLDLWGRFEVGHLRFQAYEADDVVLQVQAQDRLFTLDSMRLRSLGATLTGHGAVDANDTNRVIVVLRTELLQADLATWMPLLPIPLPDQFQAKQFAGIADVRGRLQHAFHWDLTPYPQALKADVRVWVRDGKLYHAPFLKVLSPLVRARDLDTVPFLLESGRLSWANDSLALERLNIYTSLGRIGLRGGIGLNSGYDLKLAIRWVPARQRSLVFTSPERLRALSLDRTLLHFTILGPLQKPQIGFDVRRSWKSLRKTVRPMVPLL
jgi:hypothetical protein